MQVYRLSSFSLCKNGPNTNQLFFADDSLLFCRAQVGDIQTIQEILERMEKHQVNRLIEIRLLSSLVNLLLPRFKIPLRIFLGGFGNKRV